MKMISGILSLFLISIVVTSNVYSQTPDQKIPDNSVEIINLNTDGHVETIELNTILKKSANIEMVIDHEEFVEPVMLNNTDTKFVTPTTGNGKLEEEIVTPQN